MKKRLAKIKEFETIMAWFKSVYKGRPVEISWMDKNGKYMATLIYYVRTNPYDLEQIKKWLKKF